MTKLRSLLLLVRSVPQTVDFFGPSGLGLKVLSIQETFADLQASDDITLNIKAVIKESDLCKGYSPFLCFDVMDLDSLVPTLIMKGGTLDGGVKHEAEGKFAVIRSSDGFQIGLREILFTPAQVELMKVADSTKPKHTPIKQ